MKQTNSFHPLAEAILGIVAHPARRMELVPMPNDDVYWRVEIRIEPQTEAGMKLLKDSLGNGIFFDGVVAGLGDGSAQNEAAGSLGEGDLDLNHGTWSETQPGAGVN